MKRDEHCSEEGGSPAQVTGGCRCAAVRYSAPDSFEYGGICHCASCRATTGAAGKPFLGIRRGELRITEGATQIAEFGDADGHDARCRSCGCFLYSVVREGEYVHVAMGSLIDTPTKRPERHIFIELKAEWEEVCDGLPQYEGLGPEWS